VEPEALREKEGVNYYELVRNYYDVKVRKFFVMQENWYAMKRRIPLAVRILHCRP